MKNKYTITMIGDWFKSTGTDDYNQAYRIYEKFKQFAKKHGASVDVCIRWEGTLLETETINPTRIIKIN